jgi:hypothetical protein
MGHFNILQKSNDFFVLSGFAYARQMEANPACAVTCKIFMHIIHLVWSKIPLN